MKNDEAQPSPEAARGEFFRAVEPEARRNTPALRRDNEKETGRLKAAPTYKRKGGLKTALYIRSRRLQAKR